MLHHPALANARARRASGSPLWRRKALWTRAKDLILLIDAAQMCCSHVFKLLAVLVLLAITALSLARLALRQYTLIASLTARLEANSAAKPAKRVAFVAPDRVDASTATEPLGPTLAEQEAAQAIEAVVRRRQRRAYKVGVDGERAWTEYVDWLIAPKSTDSSC